MLLFSQVSRPKAMLYGMPHWGAHYERDDVNSHRLDEGALCAECGRMAQHAHHCPPKSNGRSILLQSKWGQFVLKPALIALCAECHAAVHAHRLQIEWAWDDPSLAEVWASGWLLSHGYLPHSEKLYELGHWEIGRREGA